MKKARIVLTAITVFAVIGSAFAYKATRVAHPFFKRGVNPLICNVPTNVTYTTDPAAAINPALVVIVPYATIQGAPCDIHAYSAM